MYMLRTKGDEMEDVKRCPVCKKVLTKHESYMVRDGCRSECRKIVYERLERKWKWGDTRKIVKAYLHHLQGTFIIFLESFRRKPTIALPLLNTDYASTYTEQDKAISVYDIINPGFWT